MDEKINVTSVNISCFKNCRDNKVKYTKSFEWEMLRDDLLSEHVAVPDKDFFMFNGIKFSNNRNESFTRRCADNADLVTLAIFDFDGGMSIEEAKIRFAGYEYAGYTSYSHRTEAKGFKDAFRIVFPLIRSVSMEYYTQRKKALLEWSGVDDMSSTDRSRGFYLPSTTQDRLHEAVIWNNSGKYLDVSMFSPEVIPVYEKRNTGTVADDSLKQKIKDKLSEMSLCYEPDWMKVMWAMKGSGYTVNDFIDVTVYGSLMNQKSVSDCQYRWNHSTGMTGNAGFLINLIRKKIDKNFLVAKAKNNTGAMDALNKLKRK